MALTLPLFVANAQDAIKDLGQDATNEEDPKEKSAFWSFDISQHNLEYGNDSVGALYGDSALLLAFSSGKRINDKFSWNANAAFGTADSAKTKKFKINSNGFCESDTNDTYLSTKGETEITELSTGITYGRKIVAKQHTPIFGLTYRKLTYHYKLQYNYTGSFGCGAFTDETADVLTVNVTGLELSAGYLFRFSYKNGLAISYSQTLILSAIADYSVIQVKDIDSPSDINISFVRYF